MLWPVPFITDPLVTTEVGRDLCGSFGLVRIAPASAVWSAANRALYAPFRLSAPQQVTLLWWANGATVSGNVDCGVYSSDGTRITSIGAENAGAGVAQSGVSVVQTFNIADRTLPAGQYFLALALDNATGTILRVSPTVRHVQSFGWFQQATAYVLPATATFAAIAAATVPSFGFAGRTFV